MAKPKWTVESEIYDTIELAEIGVEQRVNQHWEVVGMVNLRDQIAVFYQQSSTWAYDDMTPFEAVPEQANA